MTNAFYNHGTFPATGSSGSSSAMRAELDLIAAGFDLLPTLSGNAGKFVLVNSGASALTVSSALSETGGNVTVAGGLAVTGTVSGVGFSSYLASPPAIGGTAAAAGSFTTLSASSTVSGAGFSAYLASPPAIGGTAAAAGSFTTLALSSTATLNAGTANQVQYLNGSKQLAGSANLTFDGTTLTAAGLSGPHNGTVGATTPSTGSFTTVAVSSTLTLSAGTANQIGYLNASKQLVGSGNMTFNGFWIQLGGGVVGSQNAGVVANGSTTAAFRMVNASTGNTATDGVDIELNVLDLNIINREAGNITLHTSGTEQVRLDASGNLGIGTASPSYKLDVAGDARSNSWIGRANGSAPTADCAVFRPADNSLGFSTANTLRATIDSSGNLGLGVTPSAWGSAAYKAFQIGQSAFMSRSGGSDCYILSNNYFDGTNFRYINSTLAGRYNQDAGTHVWYTAPSGTAGNAITFTQAMTLDASGRLMVGNTSAQGPGVTATNAFYSLSSDAATVGSLATFTGYTTVASYKANGAYLRFDTADSGGLVSEKMRLDASGNLGLGVTPSAWGAGFKVVEISPAGYLSIALASDINSGYQLNNAYYDTAWKYKNSKYAVRYDQDAAVGQHKWYNAPSGTAGNAITFTQAMTLDASGNLLVGTTSAIVGAAVGMRLVDTGSRMELGSAQSTNAYLGYSMYSTGAAAYRFYVGFGGTIFATSTTITAISDQRLKENIRDLDDGLGTVMALKPRKFDWKAGKGKDIKGDRGFIAQEFEQVLPDLIEEWKDPAPEGEEPYKAINANLIPTLVKAIQEQQALITDLRARVAALEPSGFEHFGIPKP